MTDICDKAAENEAIFLEEALAQQAQKTILRVSNHYCDDCGELIPEARREAVLGCTRCITCQEYYEKGFQS